MKKIGVRMANDLIRIHHKTECSCLGCHSLIRCLHCMFLVKVARNQKYVVRASRCTSMSLPSLTHLSSHHDHDHQSATSHTAHIHYVKGPNDMNASFGPKVCFLFFCFLFFLLILLFFFWPAAPNNQTTKQPTHCPHLPCKGPKQCICIIWAKGMFFFLFNLTYFLIYA